ncbi:MAG: decaprenyl-phosphate phosphoribosyltransferase [Ignavibacteriales bacterium]|nr:MAG: decaprenyl-phosphate phosphoribosyltransferase [Ignavibacteriales bacterium]
MIKNYFQLLRVPQWIKNGFVFVPIIFSKQIFNPDYFSLVLLAFVSFCFVSSAVYIINDIFDISLDKLHPVKKHRPIASGKISRNAGIVTAVILFLVVAGISSFLNIKFISALLIYVVLNITYSVWLKHIVIIDIMSIASGFMIRVLAGAFVISVYVSSWLILTTLFISLFLAIMKRRSELNLKISEDSSITRRVLSEYTVDFTEQMASISGAGVIICYALYSVSDRTIVNVKSENLVFTTIFVVFGIFRFMYLVYKKSKGENATEIMLTDWPMIINLILYVIVVLMIVYG